jgi:transmembrane sensor
MDYGLYQIDDFLTDDSFVQYCYDDNAAAKAKWENILAERPELTQKISEARELCLLLGIRVSPAQKAIALERLKAAIDASPEVIEPAQSPLIVHIKTYFSRWVAIAASLLIIAGAFGIYKYKAAPSGAVLYSQATDANYTIIANTDFNHRKQVTLPDGSSVLLNGSSTLKIARDYNVNNRHVLLSGEAFFSVKKNKEKPFVVITDKTATTALGTSFKVQSYPHEAEASVMLATGKVKVEYTQARLDISDVTLIPGQQAALYQGDKSFKQSNFNGKNLQNWINRKLIFNSAGLEEITGKLKEMYGIVIVPANKPASAIVFTGQFDDKNLTDVLDAIGFTNHFTYKQEGHSVKLMF